MGYRNRPLNKRAIARRKAQGFGEGRGHRYKPWHIVQRTASRGLSCRLHGWTDDRVVHLLSKLERNIFRIFDWTLDITEVREQKDLPLEETLQIAQEHGIAHPRDPVTGELAPLSTDFVIEVTRAGEPTLHARAVKYAADLADPQVREKLDIERVYWERHGVRWAIITERDVPEALVHNIRWVRPWREMAGDGTLNETDVRMIGRYLERHLGTVDEPLRDVTNECDDLLGYPPGTALKVVRHFIATRQWEVDMRTRIDTGQKLGVIRRAIVGSNARRTG